MKTSRFANSLSLFKQYRPLIHELVLRDLRIKYRRSFLGYIWSLLNPLLMMIVMTVVFSYMFRFDIPNYPLYLICGQTLWAFFNESTSISMHAIIQNGTLIRKVYIPKYIFPISRVMSSFVTMSFSLVAILIVMLLTPIPLFLLLLFCIGIGMIMSALAVYFRDVIHLYGVLTTAWMYLTPVFYPINVLPEQVATLLKFNPMYHYITFFRELVLYQTIPSFSVWALCGLFSFVSLVVGILFFRKLQRNFILHI